MPRFEYFQHFSKIHVTLVIQLFCFFDSSPIMTKTCDMKRISSMSENGKNDEVELELIHLLGQLNDAMKILENLDETNREALIQTITSMINSFNNLHKLESGVVGSVPNQLIEQIDQGNNPDDFSKKLVEECRQSAKRVEEKQKWMQAFKEKLDASIEANFKN